MSSPIHKETFHIIEAKYRVLNQYPLPKPFQDASMGPFTSFGIGAICLRDADGHEGEATLETGGATILQNNLLPKLLGRHEVPYEELYRRMYWAIRNAGFRGPAADILGCLDHALHDLAARRAGMPIYRYLGASRNRVKAYASGGGTNLTEKELVDELCQFVESGFETVKMKVGKDFGTRMREDVKRVRAVRRAIGSDISLAVDANQIWSAGEAVEFATAIAELDIAWFEEPVHSADLLAIRDYCETSPLPAAMGESETCGKVFPALIEMGVRHLQPGGVSSIQEWLDVVTLAQSHHLDLSTGGISQQLCQLVAVSESAHLTEILVPIVGTLTPFFSLQPQLRNGEFHLPDEPGSCIRFDWGKLDRENKVAFSKTWREKDFPDCQAGDKP